MNLNELKQNMENIIKGYEIKNEERHSYLVPSPKNTSKFSIGKKIPEKRFKQIAEKLPNGAEFVSIKDGGKKKLLFVSLEDDTNFNFWYPESRPEIPFYRNYRFEIPFVVSMLEKMFVRPDRVDFKFDSIRVQADNPVDHFSYYIAPHECNDEDAHYCDPRRLSSEQLSLVNGIGNSFPDVQREMMNMRSRMRSNIFAELEFRSNKERRTKTELRTYLRYEAKFDMGKPESGNNVCVQNVIELLNIMQHDIAASVVGHSFADVTDNYPYKH